MHVGLVVSGGFDPSGRDRVIPSLLWLVERLARRHRVDVFVVDYFPQPCSYPLVGATVHDLGRVAGPPGLRRFRIARRLRRAIAAHGPFDVLHAYCGIPAGVATADVAMRLRVPLLATLDAGELVRVDDIGYGSQRRWLDRIAIRSVMRNASALTVSTDYMAGLARQYGAHPTVVPFGIEPALFPLAAREDGPPWRLIRVASINRVKDYPTLLRALATVVAALPRRNDVHLDVVGEDTLDGAMQAMSVECGIAANVTFHGVKPSADLGALYARAHLHVVSSRHEAASVAITEAACTGLPTVGTAVGYVADWHPDRAVAVPVNDPEGLAHAIVALLRDRARRDAIGRAAREWTLSHDADATARELERLYADVITRQPRPARRSGTPQSA